MAAKKPATAKGVKTSKTTNATTGFTSAQRSVYRAASIQAAKSAAQGARANAIASKRVQAAFARAAKRNKYVVRSQIKIVRNTYVQARYGNQVYPVLGVPLRSSLRKKSSVSSYLQFRYGKKTFPHTKGAGSVRVTPRVKNGKIVAAGKPAVRKAQTSRSPYAANFASAAARRVPASYKAPFKARKAPRHLKAVPDTPWITAGNDEGIENCVAVAIGNSLLYSLGLRVDDEQLELVKDNKLNRALWRIWHDEPWWPTDLMWYHWTDEPEAGDIIGFETENGPHCGILLAGDKVVSWGEVVPLESEIEEAWTLKWLMTS